MFTISHHIMSYLDELCRAWQSQFPGEDMPDVWQEENISTNLVQHRKRLQQCKYEVEKEEFIVCHLEEKLAAAQF